MNFYILYFMQVKPGKEAEFILAWRRLVAETRLRYGQFSSVVFRGAKGIHLAIAGCESKKDWESFWVTKDHTMEALTAVKICLVKPSQPVPLKIVYSSDSNLLPDLSSIADLDTEQLEELELEITSAEEDTESIKS